MASQDLHFGPQDFKSFVFAGASMMINDEPESINPGVDSSVRFADCATASQDDWDYEHMVEWSDIENANLNSTDNSVIN